MKSLIVCLVCLSSACLAQVASISQLVTAGGFVDICGLSDGQSSKEQAEALKQAPPSATTDALSRALADKTADFALCVGYVVGVSQGWKEGHEHGVVAAQFPDGLPKDEEKAVKALPLKQLQAAHAAMARDVPCIPDYVTVGQERDIVVKYVRDQEKKGNPFIRMVLTPHIVWLAFQAAFLCPAQPTTPAPTGHELP